MLLLDFPHILTCEMFYYYHYNDDDVQYIYNVIISKSDPHSYEATKESPEKNSEASTVFKPMTFRIITCTHLE